MSENIQSISQGTFTIGSTSATNFVAGPGIKIDEPSAGTVRIGNDETVLYENNTSTPNAGNDIMLSESFDNFEFIRFEVLPIAGNSTMYSVFTTLGAASSGGVLMAGGCLSYYDSNGYKLFVTTIQSKNRTTLYCRYNASYHASWTATDRLSTFKCAKVVGINRKEV